MSPSAGADSLDAAIVAGIVGILLVLAMLFAYYRWMTLVILLALVGVGAVRVRRRVAHLRLDELRPQPGRRHRHHRVDRRDRRQLRRVLRADQGRAAQRPDVQNATPRSWNATWRTIWAANLVSIIGAVILFMLSVGSVRGFALYLGVTTFCDLLVLYTFTRPFMLLLASSTYMRNRSAFGIKAVAS